MEPSDEHVLRVNCDNTALVLGGQTPSPIPPDSLLGPVKGPIPLQVDLVREMGSILLPTLCQSAVSSKLRVALLLFGPAGMTPYLKILMKAKGSIIFESISLSLLFK